MRFESDLVQRTLQLWVDTFSFTGMDEPAERMKQLAVFLEEPLEEAPRQDNLEDSDVFTRIDQLVKKIPENKATATE